MSKMRTRQKVVVTITIPVGKAVYISSMDASKINGSIADLLFDEFITAFSVYDYQIVAGLPEEGNTVTLTNDVVVEVYFDLILYGVCEHDDSYTKHWTTTSGQIENIDIKKLITKMKELKGIGQYVTEDSTKIYIEEPIENLDEIEEDTIME